MRDRLIFGINDAKVRERLLRETHLTLAITYEICRAAESLTEQMRIVGDAISNTIVHALGRQSFSHKKGRHSWGKDTKQSQGPVKKECGSCGRIHAQEKCSVFG